jgi:hypothetical protein
MNTICSENNNFLNKKFDFCLLKQQLKAEHDQRVQSIRTLIKKECSDFVLKDLCIATTGSDGREEKIGTERDIELIVITKQQQIFSDVNNFIKTLVEKNKDIFSQEIEFKSLDSHPSSLLNFQGEKHERPFPTRGLDAIFLAGSKSLFQDYQTSFFRALVQGKEQIKSFHKHNIKASYKVLTQTLTSKSLDVNLKQGTLYFDNCRNKGTKYSLLRSMQYAIAYKLCMAFVNNQLKVEDSADIPHATIDRLEWLLERKIVTLPHHLNIKQVQKAYMRALYWLGESQKTYLQENRTTISVDPKKLQKTARVIDAFSKPLIYNAKTTS